MVALVMHTHLLYTVAISILVFIPTNAIPANCSGIAALMANETGMLIFSPGFPNLPSNMDCEWHISTGSNSSMVVVEIVLFELNEAQPNCTNNYVEVYDGPNKDSPRIRIMCGDISYGRITSTNSDMTIILQSDGQHNITGFVFTYYAKNKMNRPIAPCTNVSLLATDTAQYLLSPNYPDWYPSNMDCEWHITTGSDSSVVKLTFSEFILEQHQPDCTHDYVKIYDGPSTASTQLQLLCGHMYDELYTSTNPNMTIVFHSDGENNYEGFNFTYQSYKKNAEHSPDNTKAIIIVVITSIAALFLLTSFVCWAKKKIARRRLRNEQNRFSSSNTEKEATERFPDDIKFGLPPPYSSNLSDGMAEQK